jgi:hypothetical protein
LRNGTGTAHESSTRMNRLDPFDRHYLGHPELYAGTPQFKLAGGAIERALNDLSRARMPTDPFVLPTEPGRYVVQPCPDCNNANRTARRACRKRGQCRGAGLVWVTVAQNEHADLVVDP